MSEPVPGLPFWNTVLLHYWNRHRVKEPTNYGKDAKIVLDVLHKVTGLTIAEFAARLGMETWQLDRLERHGEPFKVELCEKLMKYAKEYGYRGMYKWLDNERLFRMRGLRGQRRKRSGLDYSEAALLGDLDV